MKQAEMIKLICPHISQGIEIVLCYGERCAAFNSRPNYEYLNEEGNPQLHMGKLLTVKRDDVSKRLKDLFAQGWERRYPQYTDSSLQREIEPVCWCDAMPANMECGFEAP